MNKFKKCLSILLCAVFIVSLAGLAACGPASPNGNDQGGGKGTTELKIWWSEGDQFKEILLKSIEEYSKINPNVKIVPVWQPNFDTYDKLKICIAANTAPDITKVDSVFAPSLGYKNQFVDLTQFGANDIKDKFIESCWNAGTLKEKVYALPFDANTVAFFYNKDILDKAGKEVPKTYEDIVSAGKAITGLNLNDTYAYSVPVTSGTSGWLAFQWLSWLWREGGEVLTDDWSQAVYNSTEGVDALQKIVDLIGTHKVVPENVYLEGEFYDGKVGMLDMGCWNLAKVTEKDKKANFGISTLPTLKEGVQGHSGLGLYSLGVLANSKNQKEAYKFIEFLATSKTYQIEYAKKTNLMPSLKEAYDDSYFTTNEWKIFLEQLKIAKARPGTPVWPEISDHINTAIQEALTGKKTPKEALDNAVRKSNEALAEVK